MTTPKAPTGRDRQIYEAYYGEDGASYASLARDFSISKALVITSIGRVRSWQNYRAARLAAGLVVGALLAVGAVGCGSPFDGGTGDTGADAAGPTEDAAVERADAGGRDVDAGLEAGMGEGGGGHEGGADGGIEATVDAGAEDAEGDAGCSPPSFATFTCGGTLIPVPSVVCGYKESTYTYEPLPTPAGCECAATYNCACIAPFVGGLCAGGWCVDTGSSPPVPRVYCP